MCSRDGIRGTLAGAFVVHIGGAGHAGERYQVVGPQLQLEDETAWDAAAREAAAQEAQAQAKALPCGEDM